MTDKLNSDEIRALMKPDKPYDPDAPAMTDPRNGKVYTAGRSR